MRARNRDRAVLGPPSYRPINITVFDFHRIAGSQIIKHRGLPGRFALLAQTGLLDRPAR